MFNFQTRLVKILIPEVQVLKRSTCSVKEAMVICVGECYKEERKGIESAQNQTDVARNLRKPDRLKS